MQNEPLDYEKFRNVFAIYMHLFPSQTWEDMVIAKYFEAFVQIGTTLPELEALVDYFFRNRQEFRPHPSDLIAWIKMRRSPDGVVDRTRRDGDEVPVAEAIPDSIRRKVEVLRDRLSASSVIERIKQRGNDNGCQ